jgi:PST family polysaccharide transporter
MSTEPGFGHRAVRGATYLGVSQLARLLLTTLLTVTVSRILTPGDYGVVAMTTPITGFILLFQDLGLAQAAVQARNISPERMNGLFWLNMTATLVIALVLLAIAPLVAIFYGDARPGYLTAASLFPILVGGLGLQHSALLNREMRFKPLSMIDIASNAMMFLSTLVAALILRSYWSLWIGTLVGTSTRTLLLWRNERWRPSLPISFAGIGDLARFGGNLTGFNLVNYLCRNLDNVLIARLRGAAELGLYDRSYRLMMLPLENINAPMSRIMMPILSRLRDEPERFRRAFILATRAILLVTLPGIAVAAALSDRIITFLLGAHWAAAGQVFFWLSLVGLMQPLGNVTGWLFLSSGRTREMLHWGVFSGVVTIAGFVVGVQWGSVGVAASFFFTVAARMPLLFAYSPRGTSVTPKDLWRLTLQPAVFVGATWGLTVFLAPRFETASVLAMALPAAYLVAVGVTATDSVGRELLATMRDHGLAQLRRLSLRRAGA